MSPTAHGGPTKPPAIALRGVSVSYDGGASFAVEDVSVAIARGSLTALVGASGSGKTSLLKTINRLVEPWRGDVEIDGTSTAGADAPLLRRRIGYGFQGVGLFPHMSVAENIAVTPSLLGWPRDRIRARVDELLDLVDLPRAYATRAPDALSGGQRQRVGLARALAAGPDVLLLDEPFGALDPVTRATLGDAFHAIHSRLGTTTMMVTHDIQEALLLADRILVMSAGRLAADGAPDELADAPKDSPAGRLMDAPRRQAERLRRLFPTGQDAP